MNPAPRLTSRGAKGRRFTRAATFLSAFIGEASRWGGVNLLYPPACLLCRCRLMTEEAQLFCDSCERAMPICLPPVCQRCGTELAGAYDAKALCRRCQQQPLAFEQARAPFCYRGRIREAIHAFKYDGRWRIGRWLAEEMARTATGELPLSDLEGVTPVPAHWAKTRLRGMSPSALLARSIATHLALPYCPEALHRRRWTPTQTRLTLRQRFRNVQGAFRASASRLAGKTVLLVDDVLTSGATAHACALALREAGVARVLVLTAACGAPQTSPWPPAEWDARVRRR